MLTKTSVIENGRLNEFGLKGKKNPFRKKRAGRARIAFAKDRLDWTARTMVQSNF